MKTFIEEYLQNPSQAIANAKNLSENLLWSNSIDEDNIYAQLSTGEFRLYEEMVVSQFPEDGFHAGCFASI